MVVSFSNDIAFQQLMYEGYVVSFRAGERKRTPRTGAQETWCNRGRGETKEFDVTIRHLAEMEPEENLFEEFWRMSGFTSAGAWMKAVVEMHGEVPPAGNFYLVTKGGSQ